MRISLKNLVAALAVVLGLSVFASPGEARTAFYGGGDGIVMVRDHGHGYRDRGGYYRRHGFLGDRRAYRGGSRYYRHGSYYRDRGHYGRRHWRGDRFYGRHHRYRDNGIVIRLR